MADKKEDEASADEIKRVEATEQGARGNVHSEASDEPAQEAPPPLPH